MQKWSNSYHLKRFKFFLPTSFLLVLYTRIFKQLELERVVHEIE